VISVEILTLPPRIKVLEAISAIADNRIQVLDDRNAKVVSSLGDKVYHVYVDLEAGIAYSDDNGTRYRGYIGYPIISFLMLKGVVSRNDRIGKALKGIPWKTLNEKFKKYYLVEKEVKKIAAKHGVKASEINEYIKQVLEQLKNIELRKLESLPLTAFK